MAKTKIAPQDRVRVKLECLRLLLTLKLDPAREKLISGFVGIYLELAEDEERQYLKALEELPRTEKEEIMELMTSWERKGREEGLHEATLGIALKLLRMRVGDLPPEIERRVRTLPLERLEALCESTFQISSLEDVRRWLAEQ